MRNMRVRSDTCAFIVLNMHRSLFNCLILLCHMHLVNSLLIVTQHCKWFMMIPGIIKALGFYKLLSPLFIHTKYIGSSIFIKSNRVLFNTLFKFFIVLMLEWRRKLFLLLDEVVNAFLFQFRIRPTEVGSLGLFAKQRY